MRAFDEPGRSTAYARDGMAATSHPLATLTALEVLRSRRQRGRRGGGGGRGAVRGRAADDRHRRRLLRPLRPGLGRRGGAERLRPGARGASTIDALRGSGVDGAGADEPARVTVPGAVAAWAAAAQGARHAPARRAAAARDPATPRRASRCRRASPATGSATATRIALSRGAGGLLPAGRQGAGGGPRRPLARHSPARCGASPSKRAARLLRGRARRERWWRALNAARRLARRSRTSRRRRAEDGRADPHPLPRRRASTSARPTARASWRC